MVHKIKNILIKEIKRIVGKKKAIIGISGGVDSAVVAKLCVMALGKKNVFGILMPLETYFDTTDACSFANSLKIDYRIIQIRDILSSFENEINLDTKAKGNVMTRIRMTILYAFANKINGLVIGTTNKSEMELGYFTKYGDGACDIEPIAELYKTDVYKLAKELKIPKQIINKAPSAGLWDGQTDEEEIGVTYENIDKIFKMRDSTEHKKRMPLILKIK